MQILSARAWRFQIFSEGFPSMPKTSNVDLQCSPGATEGLVEGLFPPQHLAQQGACCTQCSQDRGSFCSGLAQSGSHQLAALMDSQPWAQSDMRLEIIL